jgi:hypothetical protein
LEGFPFIKNHSPLIHPPLFVNKKIASGAMQGLISGRPEIKEREIAVALDPVSY